MSIIVIIIFTGATAVAVQNQGAKDITLDGGKKGKVDFPHHLHQNAIGGCNACHDLFPKTAGIIKDFKKQGKLKKIQVMNKICIKCHGDSHNGAEDARLAKLPDEHVCADCHEDQFNQFTKDSPKNKFAFSRLRFESGLVDLIEQSLSNSELFRILCD